MFFKCSKMNYHKEKNKIDVFKIAELYDARDKLCYFCETDECEKCIVTQLVNNALAEYEEENDCDNANIALN